MFFGVQSLKDYFWYVKNTAFFDAPSPQMDLLRGVHCLPVVGTQKCGYLSRKCSFTELSMGWLNVSRRIADTDDRKCRLIYAFVAADLLYKP